MIAPALAAIGRPTLRGLARLGAFAIFLTRSLALGRALRAELIERETNLAIWACDLDDPLLQGVARELAPERVLERLQRTPAAAVQQLAFARRRLRPPPPPDGHHDHDAARGALPSSSARR